MSFFCYNKTMSWFDKNKNKLLKTLEPINKIGSCSVFIFGSSLYKDFPGDIDLLLVFKDNILDSDRELLSLEYKKINNISNVPINFLVLTHEEYQEDLKILTNIKSKHVLLF